MEPHYASLVLVVQQLNTKIGDDFVAPPEW